MISYLTRYLGPRRAQGCADCQKQKRYTLLDAASDTLHGEFASEEVRQKRIEICKGCEYLAMGSNCKLCGCFVHVKARFKNASCDINKW